MDTSQQKRAFLDFLDQGEYMHTVEAMLKQSRSRLMLSLDDLRTFDAELTRSLMRRPAEYLPPFEEALREVVQQQDPSFAKTQPLTALRIGVQGSFGSHHVSPRGLTAPLLNSLVCVEGIVTKCTTVRPKVLKSTHYCPTTAKFTQKEYRDLTSLGGAATGSAYPTKDQDGNLLETEYGLCEYMDYQMITLQEMPERAPPGQLPRSIDVVLEGDLCDSTKPGDRIQVSGIHRALPSKSNQSGMFRTLLLCNALKPITHTLAHDAFTREDLENIRRLAKEGNVLQQLSRSLAPSICGHSYEKTALLLMLLGGSEKNLANGTHLRGDINILMLGDPSTAKSQLLRFVLRIAPLAVSTTGRGSSGVGLTAAVTKDDDTGDRRLEAGAMVLADRGVCCVDEFDKMTDADRVAIHEVMEQQTVTISKAGIHASLNARCSVVAAANPVYGKYDPNRSPMQNIGLPDSLLSRFDLLFIILDKKDAEADRRISSHVLSMHASRLAPSATPLVGMSETSSGVAKAAPMYTKSIVASVMPGSRDDELDGDGADEPEKLLSTEFVKKYIAYAKAKHTPSLSEDAANLISDNYADLRARVSTSDRDRARTLPITARTLETMIRLASAHAKCHLRHLVTSEDATAAIDLLHYALFSEERVSEKDGLEEEDEAMGAEAGGIGGAASRKRAAADSGEGGASSKAARAPAAPYDDSELEEEVEKRLTLLFAGNRDDCSFDELFDAMARADARVVASGREAVERALETMETANKVMHREGRIHLI